MKISIKNLGFVKNIDLDLNKKLTIFCGPNNTGKTYVAYAIYGLMKTIFDFHSKIFLNKTNNLLESGKVKINLFDELLQSPDFLKEIQSNYKNNLNFIFASEHKLFDKTELLINELIDSNAKQRILESTYNIKVKISNSYSLSIYKETDSQYIDCLLTNNLSENNIDELIPKNILSLILKQQIFDFISLNLVANCYIAPVERIAINIFSKELSIKRNILVDRLLELNANKNSEATFDELKRSASRYPLPIRDSLEISEDLNSIKNNISPFNKLADEIEEDILCGKIGISKEGEVQFKPLNSKSLKLPINLSASVVKSLSNLVIYFRHIARKGDFIIIDEPELNLHPDNQVIVARVLTKIMNSGFKLLINTHSDIIIRELNNLIMLHNKKSSIAKYNLLEQNTIDFNDIDVYLFHHKSRKIEKVEVNKSGFEISTIDDVINDLNNRSQELFFDSGVDND